MPRARLPLVLALLLVPTLARGAWPPNGVRVCGASGTQRDAAVAFDGHGVFVAWEDQRAGVGLSDIYVARLWPTGFVASGWPIDGRLVCGATGAQQNPRACPDGTGGAYVVWEDARAGGTNLDLYVQRVTAEGTVAIGWPANGLALVTATGHQHSPQICTDAAGGAYVAWVDERPGVLEADVYATRMLPTGAIAPGWPADGLGVCTASNLQILPSLAADGLGGALLAWVDRRSGGEYDVFAQRLLDDGTTPWVADGVIASTAPADQTSPEVAPDGAGGAFVAWNDYRAGAADVYAQHLTSGGARAAGWVAGGNAICAAVNAQSAPRIDADGLGGLLVAWEDYRTDAAGDVYVARVNGDGSRPAGWLADGNPVATATAAQITPVVQGDGAGGAIVVWRDQRVPANGDDLWGTHVAGDAAPAFGWSAGGDALCAAPNFQTQPALVTDGAGGAYVAWQDFRNSASADVYATRVGAALAPVADAPARPARAGLALTGANPFRAAVGLRLAATIAGAACVDVLDVSGRRVRVLWSGRLEPGTRTLAWDGRDEAGHDANAGVYFVRAAGTWGEQRVKVVRAR